MTDDRELLRQARDRPEVLGLHYERHAAAVFRYLARRVGPPAAEDLLGEVFVAAVEARMRVVPHASGSALPWLYGIAANVVRVHHRSAHRAAGGPGAADHDTVDWDAVDARLDAGARSRDLRHALASLSGEDRELLLLVAWEGLTPAEAAQALGITGIAARSRLHRARARAQRALDDLAHPAHPALTTSTGSTS